MLPCKSNERIFAGNVETLMTFTGRLVFTAAASDPSKRASPQMVRTLQAPWTQKYEEAMSISGDFRCENGKKRCTGGRGTAGGSLYLPKCSYLAMPINGDRD